VRSQGFMFSHDPYPYQEYCILQPADALVSLYRSYGFLHFSLGSPLDDSSVHDLYNGAVQAHLHFGSSTFSHWNTQRRLLSQVLAVLAFLAFSIACRNKQPNVGPARATVSSSAFEPFT